MPLLPHNEILERKQAKTMSVLRFLRTTIYSTSPLLGQVMGIKDRSTIHVSLSNMEKAKLVRRQTFQEMTGRLTLWGITAAGQEMSLLPGEEPIGTVFN